MSSNSTTDQASQTRGDKPMRLEVRTADGGGRLIDLAPEKKRWIIGRTPETDIHLPSLSVSRQHAELLEHEPNSWRLRDLGSRNGTHVNGENLLGERAIEPGDLIAIGEFKLMLRRGDGIQSGAMGPWADGRGGFTAAPKLVISEGGGERVAQIHELIPPRVSAAHLMVISDISQKLLETEEAPARCALLCQAMVQPPFFGRWAMLLRLDKGPADPIPKTICAVRAENIGAEPPHVSRSVLRAVIRSGESVLASNIAVTTDLEDPSELHKVALSIVADQRAMAALAAPVRQDADGIDLLYVTLPPECGAGEWLALANLASKQYQHAESAWEARRRAEVHAALEKELERARKIQSRLLPRPEALAAAQGDWLDLAVGFVPSAHVAGDYVDVLKTRDGKVLLALADVCGHGMAAALVASSVHTLVHAAVRGGQSLHELINGLNEHLCETLPGDVFVTMVAATIDPATGELRYANAGHPPPLLIGGDGIRQLRVDDGAANFPLGMMPDPMTIQSVTLSDGELLALYSDGLTEMSDAAGQMLDIDGLAQSLLRIVRGGGGTAHDASQKLLQLLEERRQGRLPDDDLSFLLARRRTS
jgi:serine phosphatase RsbU (regulator of sigma subunit)